jgi:hypothetical protein
MSLMTRICDPRFTSTQEGPKLEKESASGGIFMTHTCGYVSLFQVEEISVYCMTCQSVSCNTNRSILLVSKIEQLHLGHPDCEAE